MAESYKRVLSIYNSTSVADPPVTIPGTSYIGTYEDLIDYESISVIVTASADSAAGGLVVYFAVSDTDSNPQTRVFTHQAGQSRYDIQCDARYMKLEYTGSGDLIISTYLNQWLSKDNTGVSNGNLAAANNVIDLFGRLRVSNLETLIDIKHIPGLGLNELAVCQSLSGSGSATLGTNDPVVRMVVQAVGDSAIRQSRLYMQYQAGKSLLIYMTGIINAYPGGNQVGTSSKIGYFDHLNGPYFEYVGGTGMQVVLRTSTSGSVVDNIVTQANWNQDTLDGSGPSGLAVDWTKSLIYVINLAWLGVGIVQMGIIYSGTYYPVHIFRHTALTSTYTATSNLPIRFAISCSGTAGYGRLDMICASASSEAGYSIRGSPFAVAWPTKSVGNTETYIGSIRLRSGYRAIITLNRAGILITTGGNVEVSIYRYLWPNNPISGTNTFTMVNSGLSAMEYNTAGTWTDDGDGILLYRTYISSDALFENLNFKDVDPIFITGGIQVSTENVSDYLVITAKKVTSGGADRNTTVTLGWIETL
jgi:hypothetical protein